MGAAAAERSRTGEVIEVLLLLGAFAPGESVHAFPGLWKDSGEMAQVPVAVHEPGPPSAASWK